MAQKYPIDSVGVGLANILILKFVGFLKELFVWHYNSRYNLFKCFSYFFLHALIKTKCVSYRNNTQKDSLSEVNGTWKKKACSAEIKSFFWGLCKRQRQLQLWFLCFDLYLPRVISHSRTKSNHSFLFTSYSARWGQRYLSLPVL